MIEVDRKLVKQQINKCPIGELNRWRKHAVKCLNYFLKYRDEFEIQECNFVISHIDKRLKEIEGEIK